jgi:hypothetical protein
VIANGFPFYFNVNVITAGQAVDSVISDLQASIIPNNKKLVLNNLLSDAAALFDRGRMAQGCSRLETYERLVKASHLSDVEASHLLRPVQDIINALKGNYKISNRLFHQIRTSTTP